MRRLEENDTLEAALRDGWLKPLHLDRLAATLGAFFAQYPGSSSNSAQYLISWGKALADNCHVLFNARFGLPQGHGGANRPGPAPLCHKTFRPAA